MVDGFFLRSHVYFRYCFVQYSKDCSSVFVFFNPGVSGEVTPPPPLLPYLMLCKY